LPSDSAKSAVDTIIPFHFSPCDVDRIEEEFPYSVVKRMPKEISLIN
jgi:hypothetical protein